MTKKGATAREISEACQNLKIDKELFAAYMDYATEKFYEDKRIKYQKYRTLKWMKEYENKI